MSNDELIARIESTAKTLENVQKVARPIWAILAFLVAGAFGFGNFWFQYQDYSVNGSPALKTYIATQNQRLDKQDEQIRNQEKSLELQEQRLRWLETRQK